MSEETKEPGKTAEATPDAPAPPAKKGKAKILIVAVAVLAAAGGGAAALHHHFAARPSEPAETDTKPKYTLHLENFTVNLADPEENHFLRVTMDLALDHAPVAAEGGKEEGEHSPTVPKTRDAILSVLSTSKADDLLTPGGKEKLKRDLISSLEQKVPELGVRDIYFTEFLVQR